MVRVIRANEILQAEARGTTSTTPASGNSGNGGNGGNGGNSGNGGNGGNGGNSGYDPCKDVSSQTVRFATIVAHLYRSLLEKEEEASFSFFYASSLVLEELPRLREVELGCASFFTVRHVVFRSDITWGR